jgi:hypothetical protein
VNLNILQTYRPLQPVTWKDSLNFATLFIDFLFSDVSFNDFEIFRNINFSKEFIPVSQLQECQRQVSAHTCRNSKPQITEHMHNILC